jgi:hypothetical protein
MVERIQHMMDLESVTVGDSGHRVKIRAGYCAVPDFSESALDAVEMLLRATTALRNSRTSDDDGPEAVKVFEAASVKSVL